jgi:hypothetical protein
MQLIAQLLTESCVLASLGGLAGLLVARWTLDLMASMLPEQQARIIPTSCRIVRMTASAIWRFT